MQKTAGLVAIVDDDAATRKSLERLLTAYGYAPILFASAEEFLDSAAPNLATRLILDIHLGGMSGFELRRHLAAAHCTIPIVFITAFADDATRAEALALGCVALLEKPFDPEQLAAALEMGAET